MELSDFLARNRLSQEEWDRASISWEELVAIRDDYGQRKKQLEDAAEFVVKGMQAFVGVHSVRWRVKDADHLLEKIVRKRCENRPAKKYMDISSDNYYKVVSDLVGVRALHLFKDDVFNIHRQVSAMWSFSEKPVSYIREGDPPDLVRAFKHDNITPKIHPAGYRSVHYVLKMRPGLVDILVEVQVRTIFEEAWSEIDHKVRYPNFSENKQIESILKIFNRLAGSADELGGFIKNLSGEFDDIDERVNKADCDRDLALEEMQKLVSQLTAVEQLNEEGMSKVKMLQSELDKVKVAVKDGGDDKKDGDDYLYLKLTNGRTIKLPKTPGMHSLLGVPPDV